MESATTLPTHGWPRRGRVMSYASNLVWTEQAELGTGGGSRRSPVPPPPAPHSGADDTSWRAWKGRLAKDLALAVLPYGVAHLLFLLRYTPEGTGVIPADLLVAQLLCALGTVMLARVLQTLHDPALVQRPRAWKHAGACLLATLAMATSPGLWWFLLHG